MSAKNQPASVGKIKRLVLDEAGLDAAKRSLDQGAITPELRSMALGHHQVAKRPASYRTRLCVALQAPSLHGKGLGYPHPPVGWLFP
jgi:hypothetical protein